MTFRNGDEVRFEITADVVGNEGHGILIRMGETTMVVSPNNLIMVKRSVHEGDAVAHGGAEGRIAQKLEDGVFLVRMAGRSGAEAYVVAERSALTHVGDEPERRVTPTRETTQSTAPAPAREPRVPADDAADEATGGEQPDRDDARETDTLELTDPITEANGPKRTGDMASILTEIIGRRPAAGLEHLGTTETVQPVRGDAHSG